MSGAGIVPIVVASTGGLEDGGLTALAVPDGGIGTMVGAATSTVGTGVVGGKGDAVSVTVIHDGCAGW